MKTTIAVEEPVLLGQMPFDRPFLLLTPQDTECVCVRAAAELCGRRIEFENVRLPSPKEKEFAVSVIACRVEKGEAGHRSAGTLLMRRWDTHVIPLEQVEKFAFRQAVAA